MTEAERTQIRRHCGYANLSASEGVNSLQQYGLLEYRLAHLTEAEKKVVRHYLQTLASLENDTTPDTKLIRDWRRRLCGFVGVAAAPAIDAKGVDGAAVEDRALEMFARMGSAADVAHGWDEMSETFKGIYRHRARAELAAEAKAAPVRTEDAVLAKAMEILWGHQGSEIQETYIGIARAALAPKPPVPETVEEIEAALDRVLADAPVGEIKKQQIALIYSWLTAKGAAP